MALQFEIEPIPDNVVDGMSTSCEAAFGTSFTAYMASVQWTKVSGWHDAKLIPYEHLMISPSAQVFHYGQAVFEGMKAYRQDNKIALFRPHENAKRMMRSCERMAMPVLSEDIFITAIETLVSTDPSWINDQPVQTLYIRPFLFADQAGLGFFGRPDSFRFLVIACPVGSYFPVRKQGLKVAVELDHSRATPRGTGMAKCSGNYAGTVLAIENAARAGCDQVMWVDSCSQTKIEELSTSNVFFVINGELVTPALSGSILDGITRDSILKLANYFGIRALERSVTLDECINSCSSGRMTEAFSCGTTSMITAIGSFSIKGHDYCVGNRTEGEITKRLRIGLENIQFGRGEDPYNWRHPIER